jgi:hypothetical protein
MGLGGSISLSQTRVFRLFVSGYVISADILGVKYQQKHPGGKLLL